MRLFITEVIHFNIFHLPTVTVHGITVSSVLVCVCVCVCVCEWVWSDYRNELINPGVARLRLYISCANLALYCQILGVCPRVPGLSVAPVTGSLIGFLTSSWDYSAVSCPLHPCATETFQPSARLMWTHICVSSEIFK